jgi:TolB-like protein/DNA-binding winged helix-turn-helix (wHTH) protein
LASLLYFIGNRLCLDAGRRELLCDGAPIELKNKAFDVLCTLAQADGALLGKDLLLDTVWPGQVVEENNLQVHVSAIRKVLGRHAGPDVHLVTEAGKGYRLLGVRPGDRAIDARRADSASGPVIAVLPFDTSTADGGPDPFARGMAEEVSSALSRVRWLSVIGASSTLHVHASDPDPRSLARSLRADYLVQGSLQREGRNVRVTAQLCEAGGLTTLWSNGYDREVGNVFALQEEIAASVVCAIDPGVQQAELARIRRDPPADLQAYQCVLQAAALLRSLMPAQARGAGELLAQALQREPDYAWAHALQAWCHHVLYSRGGLDPSDRDAAVLAARTALAAGSDDAQVLATCAFVLWFDAHDLATSFDLFDRALLLSPSNFLALAASSVALAWSGQPAPAAERARRALRLNPFHPLRYLAWLGLSGSSFQEDDPVAAREAASRAVEANPAFSVPLAYLCAAQSREGDGPAAALSAAQLLRIDPGFRVSRFRQTVGVNAAVFDAFACEWLKAGLPG